MEEFLGSSLSVMTCSFCGEKKKGCLCLFGTDKLICGDCMRKQLTNASIAAVEQKGAMEIKISNTIPKALEETENVEQAGVCELSLKVCKIVQNSGGICYDDLKKGSIVRVNTRNILYKVSPRHFILPFSGERKPERYFYVEMVGGTRLYCLESEYDKI